MGSTLHLLVLNAAEGGIQFALARLDAAKKAPLQQAYAVPEAGEGQAPPASIEALEPALLCSQWWNVPSQGAELLVPALENALSRLGLGALDISHIACVRGPGGFTGIRLTLISASGLARATGALMGAVDYLPLLAEQAMTLLQAGGDKKKDSPFWILTHARRNLVHMQGFVPEPRTESDIYAPCPRALTEILVMPPEQAVEAINSHHEANPVPPVLLGSGLLRNMEAWTELSSRLPEDTLLLPELYNSPEVPVLLRSALQASYSANEIEPLYVRSSDAEENLEHISSLLHLDPAAARKRLESLTRS